MRIHNKLVRDKIPSIIEQNGQKPSIRTLSDEEYMTYLRQKLQEEVAEFLADNNGEELADIMEVVYALAATLGFTPESLDALRQKKAAERGTFNDKILLMSVDDRQPS